LSLGEISGAEEQHEFLLAFRGSRGLNAFVSKTPEGTRIFIAKQVPQTANSKII